MINEESKEKVLLTLAKHNTLMKFLKDNVSKNKSKESLQLAYKLTKATG